MFRKFARNLCIKFLENKNQEIVQIVFHGCFKGFLMESFQNFFRDFLSNSTSGFPMSFWAFLFEDVQKILFQFFQDILLDYLPLPHRLLMGNACNMIANILNYLFLLRDAFFELTRTEWFCFRMFQVLGAFRGHFSHVPYT